ncbi:MAG: C-GCAxxG-C-C family protein [Clostridiales Family XIII bacterium]|jgi:C_GCAxxG_C_C family probable redox protein|nr:C-GCAxxG-C-C family protein [Clostridiales Family XIII bacterium]
MESNEQAERVTGKLLKGNCCSQTIMSLALEDLGKENEDLVVAMTAFCGGMGHHGEICGSLAAAVAALHVCDTQKATATWQDEFMRWFRERFGAHDCRDIVGDDKKLRASLCPRLTLETYMQLRAYIA